MAVAFSAGSAADSRIARAWAAVADVPDPEVPALSVLDLGIVRGIEPPAEGDDALQVVLTPTYSGCPATEVISANVLDAVDAAGAGPARVRLQRAPAWTTDWITDAGREKLRRYGIAPPGPVAAAWASTAGGPAGAGRASAPVGLRRRGADRIACPRCESFETEQLSAFGATACKALHRCLACREPFEHFKPF